MIDYDPLTHPFDLPVQKLSVTCVAERPFYLPPRPGATPGSTLSGTFGTALWSAACDNRHLRVNPCLGREGEEPRCRNPGPCRVA